MAYYGRVRAARKGARKARLLLEKAPDVERQVARIRDSSALAAVHVEVVFERGFLHELFTCHQHRRTRQQDHQIKRWRYARRTENSEQSNG